MASAIFLVRLVYTYRFAFSDGWRSGMSLYKVIQRVKVPFQYQQSLHSKGYLSHFSEQSVNQSDFSVA